MSVRKGTSKDREMYEKFLRKNRNPIKKQLTRCQKTCIIRYKLLSRVAEGHSPMKSRQPAFVRCQFRGDEKAPADDVGAFILTLRV